MPVLAVLAMEVAADAAQRVGKRARQVVEEGFFLDRVDGFSTDLSVGSGKQRTVLVESHPADPVAAFLYCAAVVAERAFHRVVFGLCVLARFVHETPQMNRGKAIAKVLFLPVAPYLLHRLQ
jgi:hypothetical protein